MKQLKLFLDIINNANYKNITTYFLLVVIAMSYYSIGFANSETKFKDIAKSSDSGIDYRRTKSNNHYIWEPLKKKNTVSPFDFAYSPMKSHGAPGVAILDYDSDGDFDVYVTNGPGTPNSLYSNQLKEGQPLKFVDVSNLSGVDSTEMDSSGVCSGDLDNDGDSDLYVLGAGESNKLYINNNNGTFTDVTNMSDIGGRDSYSSGCSMGDVNGDGLLDIVVANTSQTWDNVLAVHIVPFDLNDHNQLFLNLGGHLFKDISKESGIEQLAGFPEEYEGSAGLTWAIAMVDYDKDSDIDIITADDQGGYPFAENGGIDKGIIHVFQNDGTGKFTDVTVQAGMNLPGDWMGLSFGDLNSDGNLDMFISNLGDYMNAEFGPYNVGQMSSRWFLGNSDLTFTAQEIKDTDATVFGWGTVMADIDNDSDTDIIYHGGMNAGIMIDASNSGVILENDGSGKFNYNSVALSKSGHNKRGVQGLAQADLNNDGFIDLVSVSNMNIPENITLLPYSANWGSSFDDNAMFFPNFKSIGPMEYSWNGVEYDNGTLSIDINNGENQNNSVSVELIGTSGLLKRGKSNRDGIGALVSFSPIGKKTTIKPVIAGSSYASQNSLLAHFGLGNSKYGRVEVLWPGGTRNRVSGVRQGEKIQVPEIPCSYSAQWKNILKYNRCVVKSLVKLIKMDVFDEQNRYEKYRNIYRLYNSAIKAYISYRKYHSIDTNH